MTGFRHICLSLLLLAAPLTSLAEEHEEDGYISNALVFDTMFIPNAYVNMIVGSQAVSVSLLEYHRAIGRYLGFSLNPEWIYVNKWKGEEDDPFTSDGWGFQAGLRGFSAGRGLSGFYLAAIFGCAWLRSSGIGFSGGFEAGYSAVWDSGVILMTGVGIKFMHVEWDTDWEKKKLSTAGPRIFLNVGYGW